MPPLHLAYRRCAHCQCFSKPVKRSLILFKPPKTVSTTRRNSLHLQQRQSWPARPLCCEACQLWQVLCLSMPAAEETPLPPKQSVSWESNITLHHVLCLTHYSPVLRTGEAQLHQGLYAACLLCDLLHVGAIYAETYSPLRSLMLEERASPAHPPFRCSQAAAASD